MKIKHLLIASLALIAAISSCNIDCKKGSGKSVSETRKTGNFSQISFAGAYKVIIKQDSVASVKITGDDNLMGNITSNVNGNKLEIKTEGSTCPSGEIVVNISVKDLSSIETAGAAELSSDGKITTHDIKFDFAGTTKLTMDLTADNVVTEGSGLTDMTLTGQATTHKINLSGSGQVDALNFVVGKYKIESSGAGSYKVNVLTDLDINTSGACDIQYKGNPANINNNKSGVGSLTKVN